ncbi:MAG: B12-binding domain-containing radical SAM protein [Omnitrophica bacterium]|nr:B12-binding domain-containing radical SAM protein [Candidatus Omnitrophota bacterium]
MKFVLATPPFDLFRDGYSTKRSIKKGHLQPLGIGYIARVALEAGIETFIVDSSVLGLDRDAAACAIAQYRPDAVGISTLTAAKAQAFELAGALKQKMNVTIIMGGPHATCYSEEILRTCQSVDFVVEGEAEKVILPLLAHIRKKTKPHGLKGVIFRNGNSIINNGIAEIEYDLDKIKPPARHLYKNTLYSPLPHAYKRLPATSMITSRGCPYSKCAFCFSSGKMKKRFRRYSPTRVADEIQHVSRNFGVQEIIFCDDNFLFNKNWIMEFCDLLMKRKIDISWSCTGRVDTVDLEMLKSVKSVGCWTVFYGIESGVQRLLDTIKKGITVEEVKNAIKWTHQAGIETRGSFMFALPGETPRDAMENIKLAISLDLDYALFHAAFPEPKTELFDIAKAYGDFEKYRGMTKATFVPEGYKDGREVEKMVRKAYKKFYFRPKYVLKKLRSIKKMSDLTKYMEGFLFLKGM